MQPKAITCGKERWGVKTLSDNLASTVSFRAKRTTVASLRRLKVPKVGRNDPRIDGIEDVTYTVKAELVEMKREDDRDIHLVIAVPNKRKRAMIVEFPDVACPGARDANATRREQMRKARRALTDACGLATGSFKKLRGTATITGVAFVDVKHGQRGLAPNGIELHPVLRFRSGGCDRG